MHVLQFFNQLAGLQFEVANRSFRGAFYENAEEFGILALDVHVQFPSADLNLSGVELECDVDLRIGLDEA